MIEIITGDLFTTDAQMICHQTNCLGVMGSGVAFQVKEKYPMVYEYYKQRCNLNLPEDLMGYSQIIKVEDNKWIVNMFAQRNFGYNKRHTNYESFYNCLEKIDAFIEAFSPNKDNNFSIAFPYNIGCDRGGASWNIIYEMINVVLGSKYNVKIYKLN